MPSTATGAVLVCRTERLPKVAQAHIAKATKAHPASWAVVSLTAEDLLPYVSALQMARHKAANLALMVIVPHANKLDDLSLRDLAQHLRRSRHQNLTFALGYPSKAKVHPLILDLAGEHLFPGRRPRLL